MLRSYEISIMFVSFVRHVPYTVHFEWKYSCLSVLEEFHNKRSIENKGLSRAHNSATCLKLPWKKKITSSGSLPYIPWCKTNTHKFFLKICPVVFELCRSLTFDLDPDVNQFTLVWHQRCTPNTTFHPSTRVLIKQSGLVWMYSIYLYSI